MTIQEQPMREYSPFEATPEERIYGNPSLYQGEPTSNDPTLYGATYDSQAADLGARIEQEVNLAEDYQPT